MDKYLLDGTREGVVIAWQDIAICNTLKGFVAAGTGDADACSSWLDKSFTALEVRAISIRCLTQHPHTILFSSHHLPLQTGMKPYAPQAFTDVFILCICTIAVECAERIGKPMAGVGPHFTNVLQWQTEVRRPHCICAYLLTLSSPFCAWNRRFGRA